MTCARRRSSRKRYLGHYSLQHGVMYAFPLSRYPQAIENEQTERKAEQLRHIKEEIKEIQVI